MTSHALSPRPLKRPRTPSALVLLLSAGLGCTGPTADDDTFTDPLLDTPPQGALRGELVLYQVEREGGARELRTTLRVRGDERDERRLSFTQMPNLPGGTRLDVWATPDRDRDGEFLRVQRFVRLAEPRVRDNRRALINGPSYRPRRIAMILVDIGGGVNITEAEARRRLFGLAATDLSLRQYYVEASYGRQDIGGDVFGPLMYPMQTCDTSGLARTLRPMVPTGYDHYLWYMGSRVSACGFTGLASLGTPQNPSRDTWYNASTSCVVLVQEPGHNFGMKHSSGMRCTDGPLVDAPEGACRHVEYGDPYDPMGSGCRHMNAAQKAYEGWFGGCNVVDVTSTGTFTLLPIAVPCNGAQALQIPMPKMRPFTRTGAPTPTPLSHYYVEMRGPFGFDRSIPPQVQIRVSTDTRRRDQGGVGTWILDMNPATPTTYDGLVAGGSYTDPAGGLKITVEALSATSATVKVEIEGGTGAPKCLDDSTFAAPGPGPESCAAAPSVPGPPVPSPDGGLVAPDGLPPPRPPTDVRPPDGTTGTTGTTPGRDGGAAGDARLEPSASAPDASRPDQPASMSGAGGAAPSGGGGTSGGTSAGGPDGAAGRLEPGNALSKSDSGCGCRVGGTQGRMPSGAAWALIAVGVCGAWRARRRSGTAGSCRDARRAQAR